MEPALNLPYETRLLLSWCSAAVLGLLLWGVGKKARHVAAGVAVMTVPLWLTAWNYVNSIQQLADGGSVLPTYDTWILSGLWSRSVLLDLGYVGAGFLLYASGGTWTGLWNQSARTLAHKAQGAGLPMGGRSEGASIGLGLLMFPVFLIATLLVNAWLYAQPSLVNGDESSVWSDMTVYHAVLLALSAGIGEELVYRGVLMVGLRRWMPAWVAVVLQALVFGFAHSGYGTFAHVILPTLFGLWAGFVAWRFGLWAAIVFHVLVDLVAFGADAAQNVHWFGPVLNLFLLVNLLATMGWGAGWVWLRLRTGQDGHGTK